MLSTNFRIVNRTSNMPNLSDFVTTEEAADMLGFHANSVRNMVYRGVLDYRKFGYFVLISKKSLKEYMDRTKGMDKYDPRRKKD